MARMKDGGKLCKEWLKAHLICKKIILTTNGLGWNAWKAQHSAQEMYDRIFSMKFLPPGRGLMGDGNKYYR